MAKTALKVKQQRKPKYSTRAYTRCNICGRPHSVLKKYGICRICFRELAYKGEIPGVKKASWQTETRTNAQVPRGKLCKRKENIVMTMTDPIADMLTRIRNANTVGHTTVEIPASNMKKAIAEILLNEGFIGGFEVIEDNKQGVIKVQMKYGAGKEKVINGIKKISKPGLKVYAKANEVPSVLGGLGIAIISTSKGIISDKEARKLGVGGEVICYVW